MKMNIRSRSGSRRILFWIIACAAIIRFLYLAEVIRGPFFDTPVIDEQFYINRAMELIQGKPLSEEALFRAPLYPIWLWLIFMITGPGYLVPRLITMVLGTVSCALIYFIGQRTFGTTCGLAAAAVSAFYFPFIFFEGTLLMDGLFIFFLLAFLLSLLKAWDCLPPSRRPPVSGQTQPGPQRTSPGPGAARRWAQAGFLCAMAAIIRPNILLFAAFLILWLGIRAFRYRSARARTVKQLAVFALFMGAVILPVTLCNYLVSGDLVLISSQAGINFYIGNNSRSTGVYTPVPGYYPFHGKYRDTVWLFSKSQAEKETGRRLLPSEVSRYWFNKGMELWKDDLLSAAVLSIKKAFIFWLGPEISNVKYVEFQRSQSTILSMPLATFHGVGPLAFIGLVLVVAGRGKTNHGNDPADQGNDSGEECPDNGAVSRRGESRYVLLAFALIYILSVVLFFNCGRYRLPVVPVLIVLACFAAISLFRALREGRWKTVLLRYVPALLIVGLLFNVDPYGVCGDDLGKANWSLANAYWERGQTDLAMTHYKKSLEHKPDYAPAYLNLGNCNLLKNEFEQAVICYQQAAALNPLNSTIHNNMALAYRGMNRMEEAWSSIKNALATGDSNPFVYDTMGLLHLEKGNVPEAIDALKQAVEFWPAYRDAWSDLGDAYEQGGMTAEAAVCREKVHNLQKR